MKHIESRPPTEPPATNVIGDALADMAQHMCPAGQYAIHFYQTYSPSFPAWAPDTNSADSGQFVTKRLRGHVLPAGAEDRFRGEPQLDEQGHWVFDEDGNMVFDYPTYDKPVIRILGQANLYDNDWPITGQPEFWGSPAPLVEAFGD